MKATIDTKANELVIRIPLQKAARSKGGTGKTMLVASSRGNKETEAKVDGHAVFVGLNAYYYPEE